MVNIIHNGDQYYIPVKIKKDGVVVTSADVADVRIQIGTTMQSYGANELTFDSATNSWLFHLTEEISRGLNRESQFQVGIKAASETEWYYSDTSVITVGASAIRDRWAT